MTTSGDVLGTGKEFISGAIQERDAASDIAGVLERLGIPEDNVPKANLALAYGLARAAVNQVEGVTDSFRNGIMTMVHEAVAYVSYYDEQIEAAAIIGTESGAISEDPKTFLENSWEIPSEEVRDEIHRVIGTDSFDGEDALVEEMRDALVAEEALKIRMNSGKYDKEGNEAVKEYLEAVALSNSFSFVGKYIAHALGETEVLDQIVPILRVMDAATRIGTDMRSTGKIKKDESDGGNIVLVVEKYRGLSRKQAGEECLAGANALDDNIREAVNRLPKEVTESITWRFMSHYYENAMNLLGAFANRTAKKL